MKRNIEITIRCLSRLFLIGMVAVIFTSLTANVYAQGKKIAKKDVPEEVLQKIESDFVSCAENITWYTSTNQDIQYFVLNAEGPNMTCEAVYNANGELVYATSTLTNVKLPKSIIKYVNDNYDGWTVTGDKKEIRNFDENLSYMQIEIEKGDESKTLYFDSNGEELPEQMALFSLKEKVRQGEIPSTVSGAIKSDFASCSDNITWYKYNRTLRPDHYVLTATGTNSSCRAVYDSRGKLISSETVAHNVKLPVDIMRFIMTEFPDWKVTEDKSVVTDFNEATKYYEVIIEKDGSKQALYFDYEGNTIDPPNS